MYTVTAKDASTAMDEVIAKLGSDAMIVSTRRVENGIEITATSDVLDLSNRIAKSTLNDNERREPKGKTTTPNIRSGSVKIEPASADNNPKRTLLIDDIAALLNKHCLLQSYSVNPYLNRYINLFESSNRFTKKFGERKYLLNEFIEEFVSDIVSESEIRLELSKELFVIGNNGVGKSTFTSKFCNEVRKKHTCADFQIIEANKKGYTPSTLLSVSAKMMQQKYTEVFLPAGSTEDTTIIEMTVSQFVESMEKGSDAIGNEVFLTIAAGMNYSALCKILRCVEQYRPKIVFTKLDEQDLSVEELIAIYNHGLEVVLLSADEKLSEGLCYATQDILTWFLRDRISES